MEIFGRDGAIIATGNISSQRGEMLRVQGAQKSQALKDLPIPDRFMHVPPTFPKGDPFNVGQMYALFAEGIRSGKPNPRLPAFDSAVELHRFIDTIQEASNSGRTVSVG